MPKRRAWLLPLVAASLAVFTSGFATRTLTAASASSSSARILFASSRDGAWALYSMNPDGSDQRRFAGNIGGIEPGAQGTGIGVPMSTPDGGEILVPLRGATAIALATGARRHFSFCTESLIWSPDGTSFACSGRSYTAPIYIAAEPGGPKQALPGTKGASPVAWSPDGNWILFSREDGSGPFYLWRIHPDGTGRARISNYTSYGTGVLWLPDGRAEFAGTRSSNTTKFERLVALDVNSGAAQVLAKIPTPDAAAWSPDGTTLVFASSEGEQHPSAMYTVDVSGADLRRLTPKGREVYDESPAWSPDGTTIVFVRQTDSGPARYASELWTMNADGSQQHQLTLPYPDGGENVEPLWVSGPVLATSPPQAHAMGNALQVPYPVAGLAARGARVAVAPYGPDDVAGISPTPPLLVWRPDSQPPESLVGALCGTITPEFFTGHTLSITCNADFLDEHRQAILDFDLRSAIPTEPVFAYNAFFGAGTQSGTVVDGPALSGGRIEFETSRWIAASRRHPRTKSILPRQILWAAHGSGRTRLRTAHRLGSLIAGNRHWLVFLAGRGAEITSPSGRPVRRIQLPAFRYSWREPAPGYVLTGDRLIRIGGGRLQIWDVRTGQLVVERSVPSKAALDAADGSYIVYTVGADLHVLSRGADKVIHTPAVDAGWHNRYGAPPLHPVYAALSSAGLFYAYDGKDSAFPGRVVFVPRSRLPH